MLVSRHLVESVLPNNLKELVNETTDDSFSTIAENLQLNLEQVKIEINDLKNTCIYQIEPEIKKSESFISKINNLHKQIDNINTELDEQENLLKNVSQIEEYKNLIDQIEMINKIVAIIESLQKFEFCLTEFKSSIDSKNYTECYDLLSQLTRITNDSNLFKSKILNDKSSEHGLRDLLNTEEILISKELKEDFVVQRERLWYELDLEWDKLITLNETSSEILIDTTSINQKFLNELTQFSNLKSNQSQSNQISTCFVFIAKLKLFSKKFLKLCQTKIINNSNQTQIEINSNSFKFKQEACQTVSLDTIQLLETKLGQIYSLMQFLSENLFKYKINAISSNKSSQNECVSITLMHLFAELTIKDFVKLIYEQLVINIIPLKEFDFTLEAKVCGALGDFEAKLKTVGYLKIDDGTFKGFLSNVEELYVRKKCKYIMETARNMMKNKHLLFELVEVEESSLDTLNFKNNNLVNELIKLEQNNTRTSLDETGLLKIPKFSISKLVKQILELVNETLSEAYKMIKENNQSVKSVSLFCLISRNLFDLYLSVVPTFYASNLRELPQLSAIMFNDFYYLSLSCLTLGHKYKCLLEGVRKNSSHLSGIGYEDLKEIVSNFSFVDLIPKLYSLGYEILNKQIENQEKNLIQFLNEDTPNGIRDLSESNNYDLLKKSLQKCILQLNNLASVWHSVLSESLFLKVFGQLFDLIVNDMVKSCLKLEDISSDDASYLHSAFSLIKQSVYDLFTKKTDDESNEFSSELVNLSFSGNLADLNAGKYIKTWQKFKYLLIVLKAGLQDIVDLWSDSKGPLALYYDSEEVRHLIKALFMITDRRSAALAKIK